MGIIESIQVYPGWYMLWLLGALLIIFWIAGWFKGGPLC